MTCVVSLRPIPGREDDDGMAGGGFNLWYLPFARYAGFDRSNILTVFC